MPKSYIYITGLYEGMGWNIRAVFWDILTDHLGSQPLLTVACLLSTSSKRTAMSSNAHMPTYLTKGKIKS